MPRVLEKACDAARKRVETGPAPTRALASHAIRQVNRYVNLQYRGERVPLGLRLMRPIYSALVLSRFREIGGGRLRLIVSGGAPLSRPVAKLLLLVGFDVVEGYGLTEASPVVACGVPGSHRLGTVGPPLDGVEVRIGSDSEILVRGPNVMKGYLNKPAETRAAIDPDGWLHTGDQGAFDSDGNLAVTGRLKELIVTSYGKKVSPAAVEAELLKGRYIDQVIVCGDGRKFLSALVVPNRRSLLDFAGTHGIECADFERLLHAPAIRALIQTEIDRLSAGLASYERVKAFSLLPEPFSVDNGLLTPSLKPKRKAIEGLYASEVERLYTGE